MAYNPTTWGSNDVITKDKLNKIEQGINTASKLSGTDIDTDKDWNGKDITNVGTISCYQIQRDLQFQAGTDTGATTLFSLSCSTRNPSTTSSKTIHHVRDTGSISLVLTSQGGDAPENSTLTTKVFKNGVEIYTNTKNSGSTYVVPGFTETITVSVKSGDVIYGQTQNSGSFTTNKTFTIVAKAIISEPFLEWIIS